MSTVTWKKQFFVAPTTEILPNDSSLDNLLLMSLSHVNPTVRTRLNASFPTENSRKGSESWLILEGLAPGKRYEVRICWLATQPTAFWIYTHPITSVFETPEMLSSLSAYAFARHEKLGEEDIQLLQSRHNQAISSISSSDTTVLLLQIYAAADYFSLNKTLMELVPPVLVDIILDPYIFNILPKSLLPTGIYLIVLAVVGWLLSGWIYHQILLPLTAPLTQRQEFTIEERKTQ